jgi:hypothetical protein
MNAAIATANPPRHPGAPDPTSHRDSTHLRLRPPIADVPRSSWGASSVVVGSADALPLWHGAWVGWLACQAALLVLVESTELAADPRMALVTRALLLTAFVTAFRKPCFFTESQRNLFTLCVVAAELGIAAGCNRLTDAGWPLWTAIGAALFLLSTSLGASSQRATDLGR